MRSHGDWLRRPLAGAILMAKVVSIHQPNFIPWLGYFHKIVHCDVFVLLDSVQLPKTGGSWVQRVKMLICGEARWMTVPVRRPEHGTMLINEARIDDSKPWRRSMLASIEQSCRKAPFFSSVYPLAERIIAHPEQNLAEFNIHGIELVLEHLGLPREKLARSSRCQATGSSNELLAGLVTELGGSRYLCGGGASGYQDDEVFARHGIEVVYQSFAHPSYEQGTGKEMIAGLSVLDALFHCSPAAILEMLMRQKPCRPVESAAASAL